MQLLSLDICLCSLFVWSRFNWIVLDGLDFNEIGLDWIGWRRLLIRTGLDGT